MGPVLLSLYAIIAFVTQSELPDESGLASWKDRYPDKYVFGGTSKLRISFQYSKHRLVAVQLRVLH